MRLKPAPNKGLLHLGFDGKKSDVLIGNCMTVNEEKITIINSTTGEYLDHVITINSTGIAVAKALYSVWFKISS